MLPAPARLMARWFQRVMLIAVLLAGVGSTLLAQTPEACETRTVVVNVRDKTWRLITPLSPAAFQGKIRGQSVKVLSNKIEMRRARIVLLLDASGSMIASRKSWDAARLIAGDIVSQTNQPGHVALIVFGETIRLTMDFSHSPSEIFARLRDLEIGNSTVRVGGKTALLDSLFDASKLFGESADGDAVYAITDGGDNDSRHALTEVEEALLQQHVRFFAFFTGKTYFPTEEERLGPALLRELAQRTGGAALNPPDVISSAVSDARQKQKDQLVAELRALYGLMSNFYTLRIELPTRLDKKRSWDLQVVDGQGKRRKDVVLFYPQELMPCPVQRAKR